MTDIDQALLYVDTSALLDIVLGQRHHSEFAHALRAHAERNGRIVSSRLLHLEVRRVEVRESLEGRDISPLRVLAGQVRPLPVDEDVWATAHQIEWHTKTLDALHLATCKLADATLLSSDAPMLGVAESMGLSIHPASGSPSSD